MKIIQVIFKVMKIVVLITVINQKCKNNHKLKFNPIKFNFLLKINRIMPSKMMIKLKMHLNDIFFFKINCL